MLILVAETKDGIHGIVHNGKVFFNGYPIDEASDCKVKQVEVESLSVHKLDIHGHLKKAEKMPIVRRSENIAVVRTEKDETLVALLCKISESDIFKKKYPSCACLQAGDAEVFKGEQRWIIINTGSHMHLF